MTFHTALPSWLLNVMEQAGGATLMLKPGDRPHVMKNTAPHRPPAARKPPEPEPEREADVATADLNDWIQGAIRRGATVLTLTVGEAPSAHVNGTVETLADAALPLSMFERAGRMMSAGEDGWREFARLKWAREFPGIGTVTCQAFSNNQSSGLVVELPDTGQGLDRLVPPHIRAACEGGEGLVVISAPVAADVAAMVGALVAWNAQRRAGFIVAFGASSGLRSVAAEATVSERPMPASDQEMVSALQCAEDEQPDVLVFTATDSVPAAHAIAAAALERLVIVGVVARTASHALEVLLVNMGPDRRALASAFRAACSWRRFRRPAGQWAVISDVLVTTERVSALIEAADITGLHMAQYNGEEGMCALDTALADAVTRRRISLREAAACAVDRKVLVNLVRQEARKAKATVPASASLGYTTEIRSDVLDPSDALWPTLVRFLTMSETQTAGNHDDLPQQPDYQNDEPERGSKPAIREGLPRSYRMRADAHYVEELDTPREAFMPRESFMLADAAGAPQPKARDVSPPTAPPTALDIHDSLMRALADIESCTNLLSSPRSSLLESAGTDVIRAEAWRASCLLQGNRVLQNGVPSGQVLCSARRLVTLVAERAESERRLRGFALHTEHEIPETLMIAGDPRVLITALSGLLLATCAVIENRSSARVSLSASVDATRQIEFAVSEVGSGVATAWESRAFDPTWNERPGGVSATVWMMAARTIAESYGGHVSVSATARGTTAKMVMPVAAA